LNIDSILNWIILGLQNMKVLNFASPKLVYMLKSFEKWLCKTRKYKTLVGGAILNYSAILKFWKKLLRRYFFIWIDVFKSKVSNDFDENWLNYGTFVSGGYLEFLRHFEVSFLKIHIFFFFLCLESRPTKYVIRSTLKLIAHGTGFSYNYSSNIIWSLLMIIE
jgi:hypothetical protein